VERKEMKDLIKKILRESSQWGGTGKDLDMKGHLGYDKKVYVHRNLNAPPYFSIKVSGGATGGKVIGYDTSIHLRDVNFVVGERGNLEVLPVDLGGNTVYSNWGTPANVNNGATTTFTYNQTSGEFQLQFQYNIIGLYAPSGTNLNGYASGIVHFMADGTTNNAAVSSIGSSGWTVTASATNGGAFTITFTNSSGATMTNVNYRITKLNRTGGG
jgi:hypothetical protein